MCLATKRCKLNLQLPPTNTLPTNSSELDLNYEYTNENPDSFLLVWLKVLSYIWILFGSVYLHIYCKNVRISSNLLMHFLIHKRWKVFFCHTLHTTSKIKLTFFLRLFLIFPSCEEVPSSEVINRLKVTSLFLLLYCAFGMYSETTSIR